MITIHDPKTFAGLWEFDCETEEGYQTVIDWTEHPIETGALVSDFGVDKPDQWNVAGLVTASPFGVAHDDGRLELMDHQLRDLAKKKQPVIVSAGFYSADAVITSVGARRGKDDPQHLPITITLKSIFIPRATLVTMPKARIKKKKRKRNSPKTTGGKATGQNPSGVTAAARKSAAKKIGAFLTGG